jgi:hypothetical protein
VNAVRHLLAQRQLAVLICMAALLLKLLVPTGYMIAVDHGRLAITVCSGLAPASGASGMSAMDHGTAMAHDADAGSGKSSEHGKPDMPCAFAGLSAQVLGSVDLVLLAIALAAVAVMALRAVPRVTPRPAPYLRPPLRGPPLSA